jgi:hypothetical protein
LQERSRKYETEHRAERTRRARERRQRLKHGTSNG